MLTELDGIEELKGVLILGATNRADIIDPALLRAGRFDATIEIPFPDREARLKILQVHTRDKPITKEVGLGELVEQTEGWSGADIELLCRKATMIAIRNLIEKKGEGVAPHELHIGARDFMQALEEVGATRRVAPIAMKP